MSLLDRIVVGDVLKMCLGLVDVARGEKGVVSLGAVITAWQRLMERVLFRVGGLGVELADICVGDGERWLDVQ